MSNQSPEKPSPGNDQAPRYTTYQHVGDAHSNEYPDHWIHEVTDEGRGVLFATPDRNDVQMMIMIFPFRVDVESLRGEPEQWMGEFLKQGGATTISPSRLFCYPAVCGITSDQAKSWITAHDDLIVAISVVYPDTAEHIYQPLFERMFASLRIQRKKQLERQRLLATVAR